MTTPPPPPDDLAPVLSDLTNRLGESEAGAEESRADTASTTDRIDAIEATLAGLDLAQPSLAPVPTSRPRLEPGPATIDFAAARARLAPATVGGPAATLDGLIGAAAAAAIDRRHTTGFRLQAELDRYDIAFAAVAGLAAVVVDFLVVRVPKSMRINGEWRQGSLLTKTLRQHGVPDDNWLSHIAKVPFDGVAGHSGDFPGIAPHSHRVQTFGHDPLVGLVIGTLDIMRGTMTGISKTGVVNVVDAGSPVTGNPFVALALEVMHLLSDAPTKMGLPLPGWSVLMSLPGTDVGGQNLARQMYLRGYDSWHLITMATGPAVIELVLRAYWGLRSHFDEDFAADTAHQAVLAGSKHLAGHPRFVAMNLAAHGIAAAGNIGKLIAYGGNPLALNYALWLNFTKKLFTWLQQQTVDPNDLLTRQAAANREALDAGWDKLAALPGFPSLILAPG